MLDDVPLERGVSAVSVARFIGVDGVFKRALVEVGAGEEADVIG